MYTNSHLVLVDSGCAQNSTFISLLPHHCAAALLPYLSLPCSFLQQCLQNKKDPINITTIVFVQVLTL